MAAAPDSGAQVPVPDEAAALVARGLAQLAVLADIGMTFARALGRVPQAAIEAANGQTPEPTPELNDAALAFSRVSRADRIAAEQAMRDAEDAQILEERRAQADLRKAMTRFIVQTAIEAEERD